MFLQASIFYWIKPDKVVQKEIRVTPNISFFVEFLKIVSQNKCLLSASDKSDLTPFSIWKWVNIIVFKCLHSQDVHNKRHNIHLSSWNWREKSDRFSKLHACMYAHSLWQTAHVLNIIELWFSTFFRWGHYWWRTFGEAFTYTQIGKGY